MTQDKELLPCDCQPGFECCDYCHRPSDVTDKADGGNKNALKRVEQFDLEHPEYQLLQAFFNVAQLEPSSEKKKALQSIDKTIDVIRALQQRGSKLTDLHLQSLGLIMGAKKDIS